MFSAILPVVTREADELLGSISLTLRVLKKKNHKNFSYFNVLLKHREMLSLLGRIYWNDLALFGFLWLVSYFSSPLRVFSNPQSEFFALSLFIFFNVKTAECEKWGWMVVEEETPWIMNLEEYRHTLERGQVWFQSTGIKRLSQWSKSYEFFGFPGQIKVMTILHCSLLSVQ